MSKQRLTPPTPDEWPGLLRELREHFGLHQDQAAERAETPLGTWRNWEQGRRVPPDSLFKLLRLEFPDFPWQKWGKRRK